jgi:hypothetical protein
VKVEGRHVRCGVERTMKQLYSSPKPISEHSMTNKEAVDVFRASAVERNYSVQVHLIRSERPIIAERCEDVTHSAVVTICNIIYT